MMLCELVFVLRSEEYYGSSTTCSVHNADGKCRHISIQQTSVRKSVHLQNIDIYNMKG
jgi:hypothetical protein